MDLSPADGAQRDRINRLLVRYGRRLSKLRENSEEFAEYGPNAIIDIQTSTVIASGIADIDALQAALALVQHSTFLNGPKTTNHPVPLRRSVQHLRPRNGGKACVRNW